MLVERIAKALRLFGGDAERVTGNEDQPIAHHAHVHGIGARPAGVARLAARAEQRERAGGRRAVVELERFLQPGLHDAAPAGFGARTREQQLHRRQLLGLLAGEQSRDEQLAVHQAVRGCTRTPALPTWRARMR